MPPTNQPGDDPQRHLRLLHRHHVLLRRRDDPADQTDREHETRPAGGGLVQGQADGRQCSLRNPVRDQHHFPRHARHGRHRNRSQGQLGQSRITL